MNINEHGLFKILASGRLQQTYKGLSKMKAMLTSLFSNKTIIKKCHICGHIMESKVEIKKCDKCKKSFLPTNYFGKVRAKNTEEFNNQFNHSDELHEDDLIKGINVIW